MDPFTVLPLELALLILRRVESHKKKLPDALRAALLVSKHWNAIGMLPDLWREFNYVRWSGDDEVVTCRAKRLLLRAQGGLRTFVTTWHAFSSPLWDGAIQAACSRIGLEEVALFTSTSLNETLSHAQVARIVTAVSSSRLIRLELDAGLAAVDVARGILERSRHIRNLRLCIPGDYCSRPLRVSTSQGEQGGRPQLKLERLSIKSLSPWLWEHLSRLGVKLTSVTLASVDYCSFMLDRDASGRVLCHILNVIRGPHLQDFEHSDGPLLHPSIQAAVFEHPRRSLIFHQLHIETGITPGLLVRLEKLDLFKCSDQALNIIMSQSLPRLRKLRLTVFCIHDTILAKILRGASDTLEYLELNSWDHPAGEVQVDATISAMGTLRELRSLTLLSCPGVTQTMLEPVLIGTRARPPLCSKVREASILVGGPMKFHSRLVESILRRFPYASKYDIHGA
jgi:hypothetical protein